jgi:hypothetical protein
MKTFLEKKYLLIVLACILLLTTILLFVMRRGRIQDSILTNTLEENKNKSDSGKFSQETNESNSNQNDDLEFDTPTTERNREQSNSSKLEEFEIIMSQVFEKWDSVLSVHFYEEQHHDDGKTMKEFKIDYEKMIKATKDVRAINFFQEHPEALDKEDTNYLSCTYHCPFHVIETIITNSDVYLQAADGQWYEQKNSSKLDEKLIEFYKLTKMQSSFELETPPIVKWSEKEFPLNLNKPLTELLEIKALWYSWYSKFDKYVDKNVTTTKLSDGSIEYKIQLVPKPETKALNSNSLPKIIQNVKADPNKEPPYKLTLIIKENVITELIVPLESPYPERLHIFRFFGYKNIQIDIPDVQR